MVLPVLLAVITEEKLLVMLLLMLMVVRLVGLLATIPSAAKKITEKAKRRRAPRKHREDHEQRDSERVAPHDSASPRAHQCRVTMPMASQSDDLRGISTRHAHQKRNGMMAARLRGKEAKCARYHARLARAVTARLTRTHAMSHALVHVKPCTTDRPV